MNISVKVKDRTGYVELTGPEEDFITMIERDYEERKNRALPGEVVDRRTVQEILSEFDHRDALANRRAARHLDKKYGIADAYENEDTVDMYSIYNIPDNDKELERYIRHASLMTEFKARLCDEQAKAMILFYLEQYSVPEIAKELGVTTVAVNRKLDKARAYYRAHKELLEEIF